MFTVFEADNVSVICCNITEGCLDREVTIEFTTLADQTATGISHYVYMPTVMPMKSSYIHCFLQLISTMHQQVE